MLTIKSVIQSWRYSADTSRDLRLDLLRGYCVAIMTIDHVGLFPAWTLAFTGGGRLWVTAAEGFILIAGIVFGLVFSRFTQEHGWPMSIARVGRRSLQLYLLGVIGYWLIATSDFILRLTRGLDTRVPENYFDLIQAALFQTQDAITILNLLPLYALLGLWGLLALYFLQRNQPGWLLVGSIALWAAARFKPGIFTIFATTFGFAIWQLLFVLGLLIGYYRKLIESRWAGYPLRALRSGVLISSALGVLIISYQIVINQTWPELAGLSNDPLWFNRAVLAPGCIIVTLWVLAGLYELITVLWRPIHKLVGWLLIPLGQHALIGFVLQAFVMYGVVRLPGWPFPDHDPWLMGWLHVVALLFVYAGTRVIAYGLGRSKLKLRRSRLGELSREEQASA
jgi:hypothetical protein